MSPDGSRRNRRPRAGGVLPIAALALAWSVSAGCGDGGGLGHDGAESLPALNASGLAAAALAPLWDLAALGRDTARFLIADVTALTADRPAAFADSALRLPGRPGRFRIQWYDGDRDGLLSTGDGLSFEFAGCAPYGQPDWRGVLHVPELILAPAAIRIPSLFADLVVAPAAGAGLDTATAPRGDAAGGQLGKQAGGGEGGVETARPAGARWIGDVAVDYVATLTGERLEMGRGTSACARVLPRGELTIDRLRVVLECQPAAGTWTAHLEADLNDSRFGPLSLRTVGLLAGALAADGRPGAAAAGEIAVAAARGGLVRARLTGPGVVALSLDADGDGVPEQSGAATWAGLLGEAD